MLQASEDLEPSEDNWARHRPLQGTRADLNRVWSSAPSAWCWHVVVVSVDTRHDQELGGRCRIEGRTNEFYQCVSRLIPCRAGSGKLGECWGDGLFWQWTVRLDDERLVDCVETDRDVILAGIRPIARSKAGYGVVSEAVGEILMRNWGDELVWKKRKDLVVCKRGDVDDSSRTQSGIVALF